jgi:diguanylate cyclase (GGDEF)-like protein
VSQREDDRLASLYSLGILDSPPEEDFDRLAALAAEICQTPMALISLVDAERLWLKARIGWDLQEVRRDLSFCTHAVEQGLEVMEVPDATLDARFSGNPFITGPSQVRFYAGALLYDEKGQGLGTLCVMDNSVRHLSESQRKALVSLAYQARALIELRRQSAARAHAELALDAADAYGPARRAVVTLDLEMRVLGWTGDAERMYGFGPDQVVGRRLVDILQGTSTGAPAADGLLERLGWWRGDVTYYRRNGTPIRVRVHIRNKLDSAGVTVGYVAQHDDISSPDIERLCSETFSSTVARIANGEALADLLTGLCRVIEVTFPGTYATVMVSDAAGQSLSVLSAPSLPMSFTASYAETPIAEGSGSCGTAAYRNEAVITVDIAEDPAWSDRGRPATEANLVSCWSQPIVGLASAVLGTVAVYRGVRHTPDGDERQLVTTMAGLAAIVLTARQTDLGRPGLDELTGLLTRPALERALSEISDDAQIAVFVVSLDRFGRTNIQYGLEAGDAALREIALRVTEVGPPEMLRARFAGDQFLMVCDAEQANALAGRLVELVRRPIAVGDAEIWLTASVGVAQGAGPFARTVLHAALSASVQARRLGGNQLLSADPGAIDFETAGLELIGALHRAVASGSLEVHYQPKVTVGGSGRIEGFEALVRWIQVDGTVIPPGVFVPIAEEVGLIGAIGEFVLRGACESVAGWGVNRSGPELSVAVNVSAVQLGPGLAPLVASALAASGLPPGRLILEVTETALADDIDRAVRALRAVKALGVRIALDDFGIGYSSLGYLNRFPIDELKIDQSFTARLGQDSAADAIVKSIISLGHTLGMRCVGEGVETPEQLQFLATANCDAYQGYLFGRPLPAAGAALLLAEEMAV